jgi:hypothetical protein
MIISRQKEQIKILLKLYRKKERVIKGEVPLHLGGMHVYTHGAEKHRIIFSYDGNSIVCILAKDFIVLSFYFFEVLYQ